MISKEGKIPNQSNYDKLIFENKSEENFPLVLSPRQAALFLGMPLNTVYQWISKGYLKRCSRKRGKHVFINRDKLVNVVFNGPDWQFTRKEP